jgi:predicted permease
LWRRSFAANPAVVGSVVRVDGAPATVIGVADSRIALPTSDVGYWTLMDLDPNGTAPFELGLDILVRLRPGVTLDGATSDASRIVREVAKENPGPHSTPGADVSDYRAVLRPLRDNLVGGVKPTLTLLIAAVGFVLFLTCVNVAALELVRSTGRRGELAIRSALGADQRRLVRVALIEGGLQAAAGAAAGLAWSAVTVRILRSLLPQAFNPTTVGQLSGGVVLAAAAVILICTGASAVFPVATALESDIQSALRQRAASTTRRVTLIRRALVVTQLTFACMLVEGAALMMMTVKATQHVDLGFKPQGLVTLQLSLPRETYRTPSEVRGVFQSLTERLAQIPGVTAVALASDLPLAGDYSPGLIGVEGRPFKADGTDPSVDVRVVSAGYFDALGVKLLAGSAFRAGDDYLDGTPVVISQSMAKVLWPDGENPIGRRIRTGPYAPWLPIVGVVSDVRNRSLTLPSRPELYLPFGAPRSPVGTSRDMAIVIRAGTSMSSVHAAAQRVALQANPDLPLYGVRDYDAIIDASRIREVTIMRTIAVFAAIALALAIAGSYAMLMFAVAQRQRELALRQAVGATAWNLVFMIGREMTQLVFVGLALGMTATALLSNLLSRFLFGVSALDARVSLATIAAVAAAGLVASLLPAYRAARVDPMLVLGSG